MEEETLKQELSPDNIELRSEQVQEVLGRPPKWIIRWGISILFIIVFTLFIGSFFFKYPDLIVSEVTITTEHPATWVVARASGKIQQLFVVDNQSVKEHDLLALIENPANYNDMLKLEEYLDSIKAFFRDYDPQFISIPDINYQLGELQSEYAQFYTSVKEYTRFRDQQYHQKKLKALKQELRNNIIHKENLVTQKSLQQDQLSIIHNQFERDSLLYVNRTISLADYENSGKELIAALQSVEQAKLSVSSSDISIDKLQQAIIEQELDFWERSEKYRTSLKTSYEALCTALESWKQSYLLRAPSSGIVTFGNFWSHNQHLVSGDKVFGIVAKNQGAIIAKVRLSSERAGKVKSGQRVNIKLDGYPYMEYGMLPGMVESVSLVPDEKLYSVHVSLPNGMTSFYGKQIEFTGELTGTAEIATDEMTLFQRLLNPLKYFFKKHT